MPRGPARERQVSRQGVEAEVEVEVEGAVLALV